MDCIQISNKSHILSYGAYWREALVRGRRLFWSECEMERGLLEGATY